MHGRIQVAWHLALNRGEQWSAPALDPEEEGGQTDACRKRRTPYLSSLGIHAT